MYPILLVHESLALGENFCHFSPHNVGTKECCYDPNKMALSCGEDNINRNVVNSVQNTITDE